MRRGPALALLVLLAGCGGGGRRDHAGFPLPDRAVAPVVSSHWSTEDERDHLKEAQAVMADAGVAPGMTVADIGAGAGYYTVRLAARVGPHGRVLAEDIVPAYRDALALRIEHDELDNVSVRLGLPDDPRLPENSFDRIFMVHMYHEIASPYAFLWHLRPALAPGGLVVVVDADRPTNAHGTPPAELACEFAAVGYVRVRQIAMPQAGGYLALFKAQGPRPAPRAIKACVAG